MDPTLIASDPNHESIDQRSFDSAERRYTFRAKADGVTDGLNMRAGDVLVIDLPSVESLRIAAQITRNLAGRRLIGICVFRLPAPDDPATLTIDQVLAALSDQNSVASIDVRIKQEAHANNTQVGVGASLECGDLSPLWYKYQSANKLAHSKEAPNPGCITVHKLTIECKNTGTVSPIVGSLRIDLAVPAGSFKAVTPQPGILIEPMCVSTSGPQPCSERRANLLRLTAQFLAAGQTRTTTLMLNGEIPMTTSVSVAMQTGGDQSYSSQNEIRIERE
jgi:hypothetical protein